MNVEAPGTSPNRALRLGDGWVVSLARAGAVAVNFCSGEEASIGDQPLPMVRSLCLGDLRRDNDDDEAVVSTSGEVYVFTELPDLIAKAAVEETSVEVTPGAGIDRCIYDRLQKLDSYYLGAFEHSLSARAKNAYELVLKAHAHRKLFYTSVGQCPVLPETALRRALLVGDAEDSAPQEIACVGDDDMVSVALGALGHKVTSFDLDEYLLTLVDRFSRQHGLGIKTVKADLCDPIEPEHRHSFDRFIADPMSNRECFDLFLSRGLGLLRSTGTCQTAVFAPTANVFREVAANMKLQLGSWNRRHNRYYSHFMALHRYESDQVEILPGEKTVPCIKSENYAAPLELYQEDYYQRRVVLLQLYDDLDNQRFIKPLYLETLIDCLCADLELKQARRQVHVDDGWCAISLCHDEGYLALHGDRHRRRITLSLYPFDPQIEDRLRHLVINAFKETAKEAYSATNPEIWDLRLR